MQLGCNILRNLYRLSHCIPATALKSMTIWQRDISSTGVLQPQLDQKAEGDRLAQTLVWRQKSPQYFFLRSSVRTELERDANLQRKTLDSCGVTSFTMNLLPYITLWYYWTSIEQMLVREGCKASKARILRSMTRPDQNLKIIKTKLYEEINFGGISYVQQCYWTFLA